MCVRDGERDRDRQSRECESKWMVFVCQKECYTVSKCVSTCVCAHIWSIPPGHWDWSVPTVTALTDSGGWPLTLRNTLLSIGRAHSLSPASDLICLHIPIFMTFMFLLSQGCGRKEKQNPSQWLDVLSFPPPICLFIPHSILLSWALSRWEETRRGPNKVFLLCR